MRAQRLSQPWARDGDLYSAPGSFILKLALGEGPADVPSMRAVRRGAQPASKLGIGVVDRLLGRLAQSCQITTVHTAAASVQGRVDGVAHFDDVEHVLGLSRTYRVDVDENASIFHLVHSMQQLSMVETAYPHYMSTLPFASAIPQAFDLEQAWGTREQIHAPAAMAYEPGDPAVIVAIVDTGVMHAHPELQDHLRTGLDTVQLDGEDMAAGIRLLGDRDRPDNEPEDEVGHGTSCACIIGGRGEQVPPGLAGGCGLLPIRVLGAAQFPGRKDPVGIGAIADIDCGVKSAIDLGAKVLNMSFGTPLADLEPGASMPHADVVQYGLARGCILIAASGNSGKEEQFAPAALEGVIAVGAVGQDGQPTAFSTRGDHVALCAPGERVASAGLHGYAFVTGTSFAAPFVSAAAALIVSRAQERAFAVDGALVRRLLVDSAQPWPHATGRGQGAGILDVVAALEALDRLIDHEPHRSRHARSTQPDNKGGPWVN